METTKNIDWEVHVGHFGQLPGDSFKMLSSSRLSNHDTREEAWEALCHLIETSSDIDPSTLVIRKPDSEFNNGGRWPSFYDSTPADLKRYHAALRVWEDREKAKVISVSELGKEGPLSPTFQGREILLKVKVGYPGSRVTDVLIGDIKVQIPNEVLRKAAV